MTDTRDKDQTRATGADMRSPGMPQGQAPARGQPQMTAMQRAAAERQARFTVFVDSAMANQATIERSLKHHGISWDFFMAALEVGLRNTMKGDPDFFDRVSPQSFLEALLKACHLGLLPDGKEGAIVRYANDAAFLPMVEGFVKILWNTGAVTEINHNVVCEGDDFDFQEGDDGFVTHRRSLKRAENAEVIGAWCVIKLATGGKLIEICDQVDLKKMAAVSRAQKGPRVDWAREMHRKGPFRRVIKRMPKTPHLSDLIAQDDTAYDLNAVAVPAQPSIARKSLFSSKVAVRRQPQEIEDARIPGPESGAPANGADDVEGVETQAGAASDAADGEVGPVDETALIGAVTAIREAESLSAVLDAVDAALPLCKDDEERAWVNETATARRTEIAPPEPLVLTAIISSTTGARQYEDANLWRDDILTKMDTLSGDPLAAFWKRNLEHILAAGENGFDEQAERVLDVAKGRNLPTEVHDVVG
jgi:recombination protein RecT